jgi:ATPase subunit of ABC transporter with duplicated ATPase domains
MIHKPIIIKDLNLSFPHKTCFENFNYIISYGSKIALIGNNGSGKTSLLRMISNQNSDAIIGYVPQIIDEESPLSGGERLNKAISSAISLRPNLLLLDEPTNHLDSKNRRSLMRMINNFDGTAIISTHDVELIKNCTDIIWHIHDGIIEVFSGEYENYITNKASDRENIEDEIHHLKKQSKEMHKKLMKEQERASKSKDRGAKNISNRKWPTIVSEAKASRAEQTSGKKKSVIDNRKSDLIDSLKSKKLPEVINPKFSITSSEIGNKTLLHIISGSVWYEEGKIIASDINIKISAKDRVAIKGNNGSGKTTILKAILNDKSVQKSGGWYIVDIEEIGYLDQNYSSLNPKNTVFETIQNLMGSWSNNDIREHLNSFLFKKNEAVNTIVRDLSGGEKARLCLAQIAAKTPKLLILDEITNNLDLETKKHVAQVLKDYPGGLMIVSHEDKFLDEICVSHNFHL